MADDIYGGPAALARAVLTTVVTSAAACGLAVVAGRTAPDLSAPGDRALEAAVALVATAAGAVALGVVAAGCLLTAVGLLARLAGHSLERLEAAARRITPFALRRVIAVGVGAGIVAAVAAPASATDRDVPGPAAPDGATTVAVVTTSDLGWQITSPAPTAPLQGAPDGAVPTPSDVATPGATAEAPPAVVPGEDSTPADTSGDATRDAAADATDTPGVTDGSSSPGDPAGGIDLDTHAGGAPGPVGASPDAPAGESATTVTVRQGDSLWAIAAAHLPEGASDSAVADAWPQWYAANRDVIGADPDLIHPGQVLVVPASAAVAEVTA